MPSDVPRRAIMELISESVLSFSELLPDHLRLGDAARPSLLSPNDHSEQKVTEYIYRLANSESIRRIVRLFPPILAHPLMNTIQWVCLRLQQKSKCPNYNDCLGTR